MPVLPRRLPGIDFPRTLVPEGLDEPTRKLADAIDQNFREVLLRFVQLIAGDASINSVLDGIFPVQLATEVQGVLPVANGGRYHEGDTFLADPDDGDFSRRLDRGGILYRWNDGEGLWLSAMPFQHPIAQPDPALLDGGTTPGVFLRSRIPTQYGTFVERVDYALRVATTNDGSNNWGVKVQNVDAAGATTDYGTVSTSADAPDTNLPKSAAINEALPADHFSMLLVTSKTGTPGGLSVYGATLTCRLIG